MSQSQRRTHCPLYLYIFLYTNIALYFIMLLNDKLDNLTGVDDGSFFTYPNRKLHFKK